MFFSCERIKSFACFLEKENIKPFIWLKGDSQAFAWIFNGLISINGPDRDRTCDLLYVKETS